VEDRDRSQATNGICYRKSGTWVGFSLSFRFSPIISRAPILLYSFVSHRRYIISVNETVVYQRAKISQISYMRDEASRQSHAPYFENSNNIYFFQNIHHEVPRYTGFSASCQVQMFSDIFSLCIHQNNKYIM
jgi:hypothetical protein